MDLTRVILGPVVTEKAERIKALQHTYVLKVSPQATKVDLKNALKKHFDVEVSSVRVHRTRSKKRMAGTMEIVKRKPAKKMMVTLKEGSKPLDLAQFKTS